jgi:hypothetical protein
MDITLPRGDIKNIKFLVNRKDGSKATDFDEIYFTVKKDFNQSEYVIQKKLTQGDITLGTDNYYHFTLHPNDTDSLRYGNYVFDIELVKGDIIKQTSVGMLTITSEVTFSNNEG